MIHIKVMGFIQIEYFIIKSDCIAKRMKLAKRGETDINS